MSLEQPFNGVKYHLCDNWVPHIQLSNNRPIKYCEIGVFYGANLLRFAELFGNTAGSHLVGIDPWIDYETYPEYKGEITNIYSVFQQNLTYSPYKGSIDIRRGFSHDILPTFPDNYFDVVYIDGNHEYEYVLADAKLAFEKTTPGGYIIFDDINWDNVRKACEVFIINPKIICICAVSTQLICQKL